MLATGLIAGVVLSPLWLGLQVTQDLVRFEAPEAALAVQAATGFWGGIAHIVWLVMIGTLSAAVASVPGIMITHLTLSIHMELDVKAEPAAPAAKKTEVADTATTAETAAKPKARATRSRKPKSEGETPKRRAPRKRTTAAKKPAKSTDDASES